MKPKKETRYGEHEFTTVEAGWTETSTPTKKQTILWSSEHEIEQAHGELRRQVKRALRDLTEADERLEANVAEGIGDLRILMRGVNPLGILQTTASDVDNAVRTLHAAIEAHGRLVSALEQ